MITTYMQYLFCFVFHTEGYFIHFFTFLKKLCFHHHSNLKVPFAESVHFMMITAPPPPHTQPTALPFCQPPHQ